MTYTVSSGTLNPTQLNSTEYGDGVGLSPKGRERRRLARLNLSLVFIYLTARTLLVIVAVLCFLCLCLFLFFYFKHFLLAASFDGLRPLLVACHCQPFCSLANKLRSFVRDFSLYFDT